VVTLAARERLCICAAAAADQHSGRSAPPRQSPPTEKAQSPVSRHRAGLRHASQTIRNPIRAQLRTSLVFVGRATAVVSREREFRIPYSVKVNSVNHRFGTAPLNHHRATDHCSFAERRSPFFAH